MIISSKENNIVKKITKLNKSSKFRKDEKIFIAEGLRLVEDAVLSDSCIDFFVFSQSATEKYKDFYEDICRKFDNIYVFSDSLFSYISETKSPQGVLACIKILDKNILFDKISNGGKYLALENMQDPGNLGTVFRTAEALGISGVILTADCCDVYSPKVVRSTMGAIFRIPFIVVNSISNFLSKNKNLTSYAAVVSNDAQQISDIKFDNPSVCIIGNEGNGLKKETIDICDNKITIPMDGRAESLNASIAAGIIMWEMIK